MKPDLSNLLTKEMDRRDFLKHIGVGLVALTGVGTLIKTMNDAGPVRRTVGYGASAYGGSRVSSRR